MKLERLTSLAYPQYFKDKADGFTRMKPPFAELYMAHIGTRKQGYFGFIKSISYTVPETGDWDALTLTPRLFEVAISYQILHRKPPQLGTKFYKSHGHNKLNQIIIQKSVNNLILKQWLVDMRIKSQN